MGYRYRIGGGGGRTAIPKRGAFDNGFSQGSWIGVTVSVCNGKDYGISMLPQNRGLEETVLEQIWT